MEVAAVDLYQNFKQQVTSTIKTSYFIDVVIEAVPRKNLFPETSTNVAILYFWKICFPSKNLFVVQKYGPAVFNLSKFSNSSGI